MTFTLVASPEPSHSPPRVLLTATEDDPAFVISTCTLYRDGVALRFTPTVSGGVALAYDYDAPFDTSLAYRADAVESGIVQAWAEAWASLASWTAVGSGWGVAAGVASSAADGSTIYRDLAGDLTSLAVTSPSNVTVQLLDASALVIASVRVSPDGNVTVTGDTVATVVGSGTFTLSVAGSSLSVAGSGWSTSVGLGSVATRVRLVAPSGASYVSQFGTSGTGNGQFADPQGIAIDASGNIYVADKTNNRVQKFNSSGVYQSQFGSFGTGNGQLKQPFGVALDASGNIYVTDSGNNRVQKFDSSGAYVSKFGTSGTGNGQFDNPRGIAIDASGNIYVADYFNNRVQKFDSSGAYVSKFGTSGTGNGQFAGPYGIAIDASGNIYVVDALNDRVQKFNSSSVYQSQFGTSGTGNGQFADPRGVAIDASGNIYITDASTNRVQKFNSSGVYQSQFGTSGTGNGQFNGPYWLKFDASGNIYVADQLNDRIQKFTPAGASVDDITADIASDDVTVTATDTTSLTGITGAWLTNAAQPELAVVINDCSQAAPDLYLTDTTRAQTVARSSSVALDIEGSADVLTIVTGPRKRETWTMEVACRTEAARRELAAILANNAAINFRQPATMAALGLDDGFYAVGDVTTNRPNGPVVNQMTTVELPLTPSRAPSFDALWSWNWGSLAQTGMTWAQAQAVFPTWLDLLIGPTT